MDENPRPLLDERKARRNISKPIKKIVMRSTHSFETEFLIRRCKEDKTTAFIYLRITVVIGNYKYTEFGN